MFRIIKWIMRIIFALLLIGSLALNVGILMIGGVAAIASNVIETVIDYSPVKSVRGTKTVYSKMNAQINKTTYRIFNRTAWMATRDFSSLAVKAVPYVGIAALVTLTAKDVNDSCATLKDLQDLKTKLNLPLEDEAEIKRICGLEVPSKDEVWQGVKNIPEATLKKIKDLGTWAKELFGGDSSDP